ncbi:MAG: carotenoid biosynthesis protein [Bacteroidales bacterium]
MKLTESKIVFFTRIFLAAIYLIGVIGISIPSFSSLYVQITPVTLLISGLLLLAFHEPWNRNSILTFLFILAIGFIIEVFGVSTGKIFGAYSYSEILGPKVLDVPLIIALNWLILVYGAYYIASYFFKHQLLRLVIGGILLVVFDLIMEPVAIELNMWTWEAGMPPFQNYVVWFVASAAMMSFFPLFRLKLKNPVATALFVYLVLFFGILNFIV